MGRGDGEQLTGAPQATARASTPKIPGAEEYKKFPRSHLYSLMAYGAEGQKQLARSEVWRRDHAAGL